MASKKKVRAKKRSPVKRGRSAAKKIRPKEPRRNNPEVKTIYVTYWASANSVEMDPNELKVGKRETVIWWLKAAGSDPITFELNPNTQHCPFGPPALNPTHTRISVLYHGTGDVDRDWRYEAQITGSNRVEISAAGPMGGGSTIKNH